MPPLYLEVTCIKPDGPDPYLRIDGIGGATGGTGPGGRWYLPIDDAIAGIESGKWSFWTQGGGRRANVYVAERYGRKYLTTDPDGVGQNNLLKLPRCP